MVSEQLLSGEFTEMTEGTRMKTLEEHIRKQDIKFTELTESFTGFQVKNDNFQRQMMSSYSKLDSIMANLNAKFDELVEQLKEDYTFVKELPLYLNKTPLIPMADGSLRLMEESLMARDKWEKSDKEIEEAASFDIEETMEEENLDHVSDTESQGFLETLGLDKTIQEVVAQEVSRWKKNDIRGTDERITNIEMVLVASSANNEGGNNLIDSQANLKVEISAKLNDDNVNEVLDFNAKSGKWLALHNKFILREDYVGKRLSAQKSQQAGFFGSALSILNSTWRIDDLLDQGMSKEMKKIHKSWAVLVTGFKGGTIVVNYRMIKVERKSNCDYLDNVLGCEYAYTLELDELTKFSGLGVNYFLMVSKVHDGSFGCCSLGYSVEMETPKSSSREFVKVREKWVYISAVEMLLVQEKPEMLLQGCVSNSNLKLIKGKTKGDVVTEQLLGSAELQDIDSDQFELELSGLKPFSGFEDSPFCIVYEDFGCCVLCCSVELGYPKSVGGEWVQVIKNLVCNFVGEMLLVQKQILDEVNKECELDPSGLVATKRFFDDAFSQCINGSIFDGLKLDMVSFAMDLLTSNSPEEQLMGAQILETFAASKRFSDDTLQKIGINLSTMERLVELLNWKDPQEEVLRKSAAKIVSHLAGKKQNSLRVAGIPGSMESIASLLHVSRSVGDAADDEIPGNSIIFDDESYSFWTFNHLGGHSSWADFQFISSQFPGSKA